MLSYEMDFSFCACKPGFVKSSHKLAAGLDIQVFASFNQGTASLQLNQCIPVGFLVITNCKVDF